MNIQTKKALIAEIEQFKEEALKMHIVQVLADSYMNTGLFTYNIDSDGSVIWYKAQARQLWDFWQISKAQAVPEGYLLVPKNNKYFSHDFNGDGFALHDTLKEAKEAAKADLDLYRDRVADGKHVDDMGEFEELTYGVVLGQAQYSVDCVVSADDHKNDEYTQYAVGTEILSLYLDDGDFVEVDHEN